MLFILFYAFGQYYYVHIHINFICFYFVNILYLLCIMCISSSNFYFEIHSSECSNYSCLLVHVNQLFVTVTRPENNKKKSQLESLQFMWQSSSTALKLRQGIWEAWERERKRERWKLCSTYNLPNYTPVSYFFPTASWLPRAHSPMRINPFMKLAFSWPNHPVKAPWALMETFWIQIITWLLLVWYIFGIIQFQLLYLSKYICFLNTFRGILLSPCSFIIIEFCFAHLIY